jgi:hypothetical protein
MAISEETLVVEIDHVQIAAPKGCECDARKFFGDLLGLSEIQKPVALRSRGGCWFRVGSRQLHIGIEDGFSPATKARPAFATRDIGALSERLEQTGVQIMWHADGCWETGSSSNVDRPTLTRSVETVCGGLDRCES